MVTPGGQPLALSLAVVGRALQVAGIGLSLMDVSYPLSGPPFPAPDASGVNGNWRDATSIRARDPLAIDLDGNGIQTTGISGSNPILFDHDADGIRTGTGWVSGGDAWLVMDRNGNGTIDSGRELFGVDTQITTQSYGGSLNYPVTRTASNGFEALSALDDNHDHVFDAQDAAFGQVQLWQDFNQDGISQANELSTLSSKGVVSISLASSTSTQDLGNGNSITAAATVTRSNGSTTTVDSVNVGSDGTAANLNLADNPFYRQFSDTIPLTDAAKALPDMQGSGALRDLREAMSLGTEAAQDLPQRVAAFEDARWTGRLRRCRRAFYDLRERQG